MAKPKRESPRAWVAPTITAFAALVGSVLGGGGVTAFLRHQNFKALEVREREAAIELGKLAALQAAAERMPAVHRAIESTNLTPEERDRLRKVLDEAIGQVASACLPPEGEVAPDK